MCKASFSISLGATYLQELIIKGTPVIFMQSGTFRSV
jgi:hypothetical protein